MNSFAASMTAGAIATVVLAVVFLIQNATGIASSASFIGLVTQFGNEQMQAYGGSVGWGIHFFVGVVIYGLLFGLTNYLMPSPGAVLKAVGLAGIFWLIMMLLFMPMLGIGVLGLENGVAVPLVTLIMHVIYGAVLGAAYQKLHKPKADALP